MSETPAQVLIVCGLCRQTAPEEEPFSVPNDEVGIALMRAHLAEAHGIEWS